MFFSSRKHASLFSFVMGILEFPRTRLPPRSASWGHEQDVKQSGSKKPLGVHGLGASLGFAAFLDLFLSGRTESVLFKDGIRLLNRHERAKQLSIPFSARGSLQGRFRRFL